MTVTFHPAVQQDFNEAIAHYEGEGGTPLGDRFEAEFRFCLAAIKAGPGRFPRDHLNPTFRRKTTRIGADGGVDVQLFQNGNPQPMMVIQCKAWDAYKVGIKPLRELYGVMAADKVANGAFFTTGEFTSEAEDFARDKNLDLVNGREFLSRIGQLAPDGQEKLLNLATAGDYTTPSCPSCGPKMLRRTASKGPNAGSEFWGCRHYPRCKQTFRISKVV